MGEISFFKPSDELATAILLVSAGKTLDEVINECRGKIAERDVIATMMYLANEGKLSVADGKTVVCS